MWVAKQAVSTIPGFGSAFDLTRYGVMLPIRKLNCYLRDVSRYTTLQTTPDLFSEVAPKFLEAGHYWKVQLQHAWISPSWNLPAGV